MSRLSNIYLNNIDLGPPASLAKSNLQLPLQLLPLDYHRPPQHVKTNVSHLPPKQVHHYNIHNDDNSCMLFLLFFILFYY